jgi:undecaprenyl-phosphate 4-deoxy-4-formamido-L-arabinose transferase
MTRTVSVVVPVYRSEQSLPELVRRLSAVLPAVASEWELVLVNDGSPDRSWDVLRELATTNPNVRALDLMRNYGQHNALLCGIRAARYEICVTLDDDLQHPPEEIPKLLAKLDEGFDMVFGTPEREQHGFLRDAASRVIKFALQKAMGVSHALNVSSFRAFRTRLREGFAGYSSPYLVIDVLLGWSTTRMGAVTVPHQPRAYGSSTYSFRKLAVHALNLTTGFTTWPLRLASLIGFTFTCIGLLVLLYVLFAFFVWGRNVPGFAFMASALSIFSGAQLFALGVIGEYLARMYVRSMERPPYVVRSEVTAP